MEHNVDVEQWITSIMINLGCSSPSSPGASGAVLTVLSRNSFKSRVSKDFMWLTSSIWMCGGAVHVCKQLISIFLFTLSFQTAVIWHFSLATNKSANLSVNSLNSSPLCSGAWVTAHYSLSRPKNCVCLTFSTLCYWSPMVSEKSVHTPTSNSSTVKHSANTLQTD